MARKKKKKKKAGKKKQQRANIKEFNRKFNKRNPVTKEKVVKDIYEGKKRISQLTEKESINVLRNKAIPIFEEANRRWTRLDMEGLDSLAIERALESGREYFSLDGLETKEQIFAELTRARTFLADKSSTLEGAFIQNVKINSEEYRGLFGNQYNTSEHDYKRYDTNKIDPRYASEVFRAYRNLESFRVDDITGAGGYGSENLIIAMYDAMVRGQDPLVYGNDVLDSWKNMHSEYWNKRYEETMKATEFYNNEYSNDFINKLDF